jgi:hypothetical protein
MDFTYGDCKKEMDMVNKAFIEIMIEGDANGRGFQYPIPTYSITKDFDWSDTENNRLLFEMTAKYGTPYFSNYVNSDMKPSDVRSMCCRLRLDLRELRKKSGGFFGSGEAPVPSALSRSICRESPIFRQTSQEFYSPARQDDGHCGTFPAHQETASSQSFSMPDCIRIPNAISARSAIISRTIGLIGMNEVGLNACWLREGSDAQGDPGIHEGSAESYATRLSDYQEQYGDLYNLEATPAESTTYRLAKHDKRKAIRTSSRQDFRDENPLLHQQLASAGRLYLRHFHALDIRTNCRHCIPPALCSTPSSERSFRTGRLQRRSSARSRIITSCLTIRSVPTYSVCAEHGYIAGEVYECPQCGAEDGSLQPHHRLLSPGAELE